MCLSFTFSLVRNKPGATSEDPLSLDSDDESSLSPGGHAQVPINLDLDDALVTTFSAVATSTAAASTTTASAAVASTAQSSPADIIRKVSMEIQPTMTPYGYSILVLASEIIDKECPKARSGGAAFAAARVLKVPPQQIVIWMKTAEQIFAKEVCIVWLQATRPETFVEWLGAARRARLEYVPADSAQDASLADKMCLDEHFLLGYERSGSAARPNVAAMELLRWLLLDKPRPQLAFCILQLKPILELGGDTLDSAMPPSWLSQWEARAAKVTSTRFYWVGQGGDEVPIMDARVRERSAASSYSSAARERLRCAAATRMPFCRGPLSNFANMCGVCRAKPESVLRDYCLGLTKTGRATIGCQLNRRCSACTGKDRRKLQDGEELVYTRGRGNALDLCPGGCKGKDKVMMRTNHACQKGYRDYLNKGVKLDAYKCVYRAALPPPQKRARRD